MSGSGGGPRLHDVALALHRWVALAFSLLVLVLGVTGSIMAFEGDIDRAFHPHLYHASVGPGPDLSLARLAAIVATRLHTTPPQAFRLPERPGDSYSALTNDAEVFLDGRTGRVLGTGGDRVVLAAIHFLHVRLLAGRAGEGVMTAAGIATLWLALTGIALWWRGKRAAFRRGGSALRALVDLHAVTGLYAWLLVMVFSLTAIGLSFEGRLGHWMYGATGTRPVPRVARSTGRPGTRPVDADAAVAAARAAVPDAVPIRVLPPRGPDGCFSVTLRVPGDHTLFGRSWVLVDRFDGRVLAQQDIRRAPVPTRALFLIRALHTGDLLGWPTHLLMSLASLTLAAEVVTGLLLWWRRRRARA